MKVLHITPSYKPAFVYGGPTVSVSRLCEELVKIGVEVSVFSTTANGRTELEVETGKQIKIDSVNVYYFKRWSGDHTHFSPALLWALWKNGSKYDTIHIHSWWNLVSVLAMLICRLRGWRPFLAPRGMLSHYTFKHENTFKKKLIHTSIGKYLLPYCILHATTALEVRDCQRIIPNWKYIILPNIISLPTKTYTRRGEVNSEVVLELIFLSRVDPKKGLELLFRALSYTSFPYHLNIYGNRDDAYEMQLRKLSRLLKIEKHVHWHGWVDSEEKYEAIERADLFVLTSYNENFANVVLESLAVKTPVLISDQVGMAEYVEKNNLGWVCKLDSEKIKGSLEEAYEEFRKQALANKAIHHNLHDHFGSAKLAKSYLKIYNSFKNESA